MKHFSAFSAFFHVCGSSFGLLSSQENHSQSFFVVITLEINLINGEQENKIFLEKAKKIS